MEDHHVCERFATALVLADENAVGQDASVEGIEILEDGRFAAAVEILSEIDADIARHIRTGGNNHIAQAVPIDIGDGDPDAAAIRCRRIVHEEIGNGTIDGGHGPIVK